MDAYERYQMTIGIECHVQLATKTKLFSPADNDARGAEANSKTHPIDFGLPGMLPVLNYQAVRLAVIAGKALNAEIAPISRFDRKHYFYPDLPKGYQTTQMYQPIIVGGYVEVPGEAGQSTQVRIHHAHLEEDAGKLIHKKDYSLVDLNRAGTPLIEIVSEPDIHSAEEARAYATELYLLMTYAGVTRGDLYQGNMRFDVNISVAPKGSAELGIRAEIKNLNSFRSVERAAEYEFNRQVELIERGEKIVQETRGWSDDTGKTTTQRSKEDAQDYRYMPDADIPPVVLSKETIENIQSEIGALPGDYRQDFADLEVDYSVVNSLLANKSYAELVSRIKQQDLASARRTANWIASNLDRESGQVADVIPDPQDLIELSQMVENSEISSNSAGDIFNQLMSGAKQPREIAKQKNLLQNSDEDAIAAIVEEVLSDSASQKAVSDVKAGNEKAIGYLVGQVMKRSKGQANPELSQRLIKERIL